MFHRTISASQSFAVMLSITAFVFTTAVSVAHASVDTKIVDGDSAILSAIEGKVSFVKRFTVVPLSREGISDRPSLQVAGGDDISTRCQDGSCPQSTPYWSMLVTDGDRDYEFNGAFARGRENAPESVMIRGVRIQAGSNVVVQGDVLPVSSTYGIISDLKSISVVHSN